jgi:glycerol-3-phosphate dehydrogenase
VHCDLLRAEGAHGDLLIIGGGVYGIALALEASRRGLAVLLVERGEFGAATSANSLRIVHGGLRYLQSFDLRRFRDSLAERRWFLRCFPTLVEPLPCLMPLYSPPRGGTLRRVAALRLALAGGGFLGKRRSAGNPDDSALPGGRILDAAETARRAPAIDPRGLQGGLLWYDAFMPDSEGLLREMLGWARACGAQAFDHRTAERLLVEAGRAAGVVARDGRTGEPRELRARYVVNCAGPWVRELAAVFDRDLPELFTPALAFNLVLDRAPLATEALAVAAPGRGSHTVFLVPWRGKILAGTCHLPGPAPAGPTEEQIQGFIADLNAALPALALHRSEVLDVRWGILPAERPGGADPAVRPVIHDHGAAGGPRGLISVSGVKFTTARAIAERTLLRIYGRELPAYTMAEGPQAPSLPVAAARFNP